jgi:hypothetical protein
MESLSKVQRNIFKRNIVDKIIGIMIDHKLSYNDAVDVLCKTSYCLKNTKLSFSE